MFLTIPNITEQYPRVNPSLIKQKTCLSRYVRTLAPANFRTTRTNEHSEQRTKPFPEQPEGAQRYSRHWFRALGHVLVCLQVDWLIRLIAGSCGMPQAQRYFRHWFRRLGYNLVCLYVNRGNTVDKYRRKKAPLRGHEGKRSGKVQAKKSPLAGAFWRGRDYRVLKALESLS